MTMLQLQRVSVLFVFFIAAIFIGSGVGVTKPISSVPLFSQIFCIVKTHFTCWISRLYLTGVAAAQLRGHLSHMNVIRGI